MISAIEQVKEKLEKAKESYLPSNLELSNLTNDQSSRVEHQVDELI